MEAGKTQIQVRLSTEGKILSVNEAFLAFFGKQESDAAGCNIDSFIIGGERDKIGESLQSLIPENPLEVWEYCVYDYNGDIRWLRWVILAVFNKDCKIGEIIGVAEDITVEKNAEDELRTSEEKYRSLILHIPDVAWSSDEDYRIVFLSPNVEMLTGYTKDEEYQCGTWMNWVRKIHPEDRAQARNALRELIEGRKHYDIEYRFQRKDGQWIWIHDRSLGRYERNGRLYADGLLTDITEKKNEEQARRQMQEKAQVNSRLASVGQMASGIAHEINNPLTSIIAISEVLLQRDIKGENREDVELIHSGAKRIAAIVSRLLTFARQHKPAHNYVDVNSLIETTIALRSYALETGNIKVDFQKDEELPRIRADGGQLQQVFLNIILNAEYEMKRSNNRGNITITTRRNGGKIQISFRDSGNGITPGNIDKVFEPFFTTKATGEGTGLGLSVCHGIITAHNGEISVESKPEEGATFIIELPVPTSEGEQW